MLFPHAAVASPHYLATAAGAGVLQRGGNAVDAAVATNLVLAVVCPHLCGVGGDLIGMVWFDGALHGINSTGALPQAAKLPDDERVPVHGIGAVTVPGAPAGWVAMHERFGSIPLADLAAPAIRYAREGFWPSPNLADGLERSRQLLAQDPESKRLFLTDGKIVNPELADVIADLPGFYTGPVAHNAPEPFTPVDFAAHRAEWVDPMRTEWMGVEVCEMPPNSRGHLVLAALDRLEPLEGLKDDDSELHMRLMRAIGVAAPTGDTVYLATWDEYGNVVSVNESNYMGFGSGVTVPGTGVHLHNRGAYHTAATYKGGAKPVHTLAPGMTLRDGSPEIAFGTMGGEAQIQIHMQLLARIYALGYDAQSAVAAPRWVKHGEADLLAEEGLPPLGGGPMPHPGIAGHAHIIRRAQRGLDAGSDPRCDGSVGGY